jgi:hypothetical protein
MTTSDSELAVVLLADDVASAGDMIDAVRKSAEAAKLRVELVVASSDPALAHLSDPGVRIVEVFPLESAYRRNRGLLQSHAPWVAFLENGQLPDETWAEAALDPFRSDHDVAAVIGLEPGVPSGTGGVSSAIRPVRRCGGNIVYDRAALLSLHGFRLFSNAPAGSAAPDVETVLRLRAQGRCVVTSADLAVALASNSPLHSPDFGVGHVLRRMHARNLIVRYTAAAVKDVATRRRSERRDAARHARDLFSGLRSKTGQTAADYVLQHAPPTVMAALDGEDLSLLAAPRKAKLQFLYRAGPRVLHLYVAPTDKLRRAISAREAIGQTPAVTGVPRVCLTEESLDALWMIEDFVPGSPVTAADFGAAEDVLADWVVRLGGPPATVLGDTEAWRSHADRLRGADFPAPAGPRLARALEAVEELPSRQMHGDLQPKNVLVDAGQFSAVDWENASTVFAPGLDLLYLFLLANGAGPDENVIEELVGSSHRSKSVLLASLARLGVEDAALSDVLCVLLGTWAIGERRRRSRLGVDPGPSVFEPLFLKWVTRLGSTCDST